ncbi:MAG: sensor histidine kinase [Kineosporiaceae bacterium]
MSTPQLPPRQRIGVVAVAVIALLAGGVAWALLQGSPRATEPVIRATLAVIAAWSFVTAGLAAVVTRPQNRTGRLMVLTGFLILPSTLAYADVPWVFTVGILVSALPQAVFAHLLLAFPEGRLHSLAERVLVSVAYLDATVGQFVMLLLMDYRNVAGCPCPQNLLYVIDAPAAHDLVMTVQRVVAVPMIVGIVVVLARRWRRATPPLRRSLAPVLWTGAVTAVLAGATLVLDQLSSPVTDAVGLAASAALAVVPLGFLVGLLRTRLARAAVGDLVIELGRQLGPGQLQGALARALGDRSLELAYRLPDADDYVGLDGRHADLPAKGDTRAVTFVERDGERIAAVVHDVALAENPGLVRAACAAAGLALENERLQADLRARLDDLRASRARIVQAGDIERRRLERNLHDGAQQRLVSLAVALGLAEARLPADPVGARTVICTARRDLGEALQELRELAHGIHPAILSDRGLGGALEALADRTPIPVELSVAPGRLPEPVEAAAYYVVAEAVANATKHARADGVSVDVARADGRLLVTVADDGVGGAATSGGSGLRGLGDRVEALGGTFRVTSPRDRGTTVRAELPCG